MLSVWKDKDYQTLTLEQQGLFCGFLAYPGISWCGVIDYIPKRLVEISNHLDRADLVRLISELHAAQFVVADPESDELLIRRFVHYDGIMKMPNVAKAMAKAADKIHSPMLRDVLINELARSWLETPHLLGWKCLSEGFSDLLEEIKSAAEAYSDPSPNPSPNPSDDSSDPWGP